MQKSRKERPSKNSPFVEKFNCRRSSRIQNQNDEDNAMHNHRPLVMSTPKKTYRNTEPLSELSQSLKKSESLLSVNSSNKKFHKNYDPNIEIRQVNERLNKRNSTSWADQSFLNDDEEEDYIKYSEKLKRYQRNIKLEDDVNVLTRRQNDIDKGKSKQCYKNFVYEVAKDLRKPFQPRTPNKFLKMSRRGWDGLVRKWKKHIHAWNEPKFEELYAAGVEMDCCNSDVASIASFKDSLHDDSKESVKEEPSDEEATLQGTKITRKRTFNSKNNVEHDNFDDETLEKAPLHTSSKLIDLHTGLTNDAAALNMNSNKRLKLSGL